MPLHIEILQKRAQGERSTCSVNLISIAAVPIRKFLVCSPRSLDKVRDFFPIGKVSDPVQLKPDCSFCLVLGELAQH